MLSKLLHFFKTPAWIFALAPAGVFSQIPGQLPATLPQGAEFRYTEFAIPVSPALSLLNADPSMVGMPSVVRDFKVDWSFKTYRLTPNLCLEATPVWSFFYDRPQNSYAAYQRAGWLMRRLSSTNLSVGTIAQDTVRELAWAVKINLFSQKDFYGTKEVFQMGNQDIRPMRDTIAAQLQRLVDSPDTAQTDGGKFERAYKIFNMNQQLESMDMQLRDRSNFLRGIFMRRFWNSTSLDLAFGKTFLYQGDRIDSLQLKQQGFGVWLTGGFGLGDSWFVSGMIKNVMFNEKEFSFFRGINIRYGNVKFNFFGEMVLQNDQRRQTNFETGERSLKNDAHVQLGYGGSFRIGTNLLLSFGLRTDYDRNLNFRSLLPVANLSCLMR